MMMKQHQYHNLQCSSKYQRNAKIVLWMTAMTLVVATIVYNKKKEQML